MIPPAAREKCILESKKYALTKSKERIKGRGEVFTPVELVLEILDQLPPEVWIEGKTYLDPTVGTGNFLAAVLIIKQELGHKNPLSTIYGVDIMQDNVNECQQRLIDIAGNTPENWKIVENNIRCKDGLEYNYSFESEDTPSEYYKKDRPPPKVKKEPPKKAEVVEDWTKIIS